jgi:integrase
MAKVRKRTWSNKAGEQTAWIADYFDQENKRHIKTFETKKAAAAWLIAAQGEVTRGVHTPAASSITVADAGEMWITQAETDGLEASTVRQYRQHLDYHIKPFIGTLKLAELSPASVPDYRNRLLRDGRSRAMAKKVISSLGAILATAMANGKVARNVVKEQSRTRQRRLEKRHDKRLEVGVDIPTKDEIRAMLAHAQGRWRVVVVTTVFTGLRASELRGLRWVDVDLDRAVLTVRQRADRWNKIGSPKSESGRRDVPLAPLVVNALREWKLARRLHAPVDLDQAECGDLVFPNGVGSAVTLSTIHQRGLGPLQVAAGITSDISRPKYGMHALRHAAASLFIEQGFTAKRVQAMMGHSTIQMTFDTYGHLFPSAADDQAAMAQLEARLLQQNAT